MNVCHKCIEDSELGNIIESNNEKGYCDYCKKNNTFIMDIEIIAEKIINAIEYEFDDPVNGLAWDGGWIEGNREVIDNHDMLADYVGIGGSKAFKDILYLLPDNDWYPNEFYGLTDLEVMLYSWDRFKQEVKYKNRYFFSFDKLEEHDEIKKPFIFLKEICNIFEDNDFICTIPVGTTIYRGRWSNKNIKYYTEQDLGKPPKESAIYPNRFSPTGIPMFYGSDKSETCYEETNTSKPGIFSLGEWTTNREIKIIDLTNHLRFSLKEQKHIIDNYPSIYDVNNRNKIQTYNFLVSFANDLIKPVNKDGMEHIEYVPTQIIVEYIKDIYDFEDKIEGFAYYSAKNGLKNYVFFSDDNPFILQKVTHTQYT